MAKKTEAQIKDLKKRLRKLFKVVTNKQSMKTLGGYAVDELQKRTRLGYGVKKSLGPKISLKQLRDHSAGYKRYRKRNRRSLDTTTRPAKQNLTFTGQLLRDLRLTKVTRSNFTIGHSSRKRRGDDFSNRTLSKWVQDEGRTYMDITDKEYKRLLRFYQNKIVRPKLAKV